MKGFRECFKRAWTIALSSAVMITSLPQWTFAQEPDDEADAVYEAVTNDTEDSEYYSPYTITVNCPAGIEVDYSSIKTPEDLKNGEDPDPSNWLINVNGELHISSSQDFVTDLFSYRTDISIPLKGTLPDNKTIEISSIETGHAPYDKIAWFEDGVGRASYMFLTEPTEDGKRTMVEYLSSAIVTLRIVDRPDAGKIAVDTSTLNNTTVALKSGGNVDEDGNWSIWGPGKFTYTILSKKGYMPVVKRDGDEVYLPDPVLNESKDGFLYTLDEDLNNPEEYYDGTIEVTEELRDWTLSVDKDNGKVTSVVEQTLDSGATKLEGTDTGTSMEYRINPFVNTIIQLNPNDGYRISVVTLNGGEVSLEDGNKFVLSPDPMEWLNNGVPSIVVYTEEAASWGDVTDPAIQARFENDASKVPEGMWLTFGNSVKLESDEENPLSIEVYTGNAITYDDKIKVYEGTKLLKNNTDYTISYTDNIDAMTEAKPHASFTISGEGEYTGSLTFIFTIRPADITEAVLKEETVTVTAGTGLGTIKPELTFNGKALTDKDFKIGYFEKYDKDGKKTGTVEEADIATYKAKASESYIAVIWGHNNFTGQLNKPVVKVTGNDIEPKEVLYMERATVTIPKQSYTGSKIDVAALFESGQAKVKLKKKVLKYNVDYRIVNSDDEYKSVGEHGVFIEGTENPDAEISYSGRVLGIFKITGTPASKVKVACLATTAEYTGSPITLSDLYLKDKTGYNAVTLYTVKDKKNIALSSDDYEVSTEGSAAVGKQKVTFTLKNGYSGTITKTINVKPYNLTKNFGSTKVTVTAADTAYSKAGAVTSVTVKRGTATLREGTDYTLSFKNNKKIAAKDAKKNPPTVVVTGKGNYKGKLNAAFTINKVKASDFFTLSIEDKDYKAKQSKGYFKVIPKIMSEGKTVSAGKGKDIEPVSKDAYKYFYDDTNTAIDPKATNVPENRLIRVEVTVKCGPNSPYIGDNTSTGETKLVGYYRLISKNNNIKNATVTVVNDSALTYRGTSPLSIKASDLKVVPKGSKNPLKSDTDYVIESVTDNRSKGKAIIVVKGTGNYGGRKTIKVKLKAGT